MNPSIQGRIFYDVFYDLCMEYLDDGDDLELTKVDSSPAVVNPHTTHFAFLDLPKTPKIWIYTLPFVKPRGPYLGTARPSVPVCRDYSVHVVRLLA